MNKTASEIIERPSSWKQDRNGALAMAALAAVIGIASITLGAGKTVTAIAMTVCVSFLYLAVVAHRATKKK